MGRDEGVTLVMQTEDKQGWFWYIPLHDDMISVGVVAGIRRPCSRIAGRTSRPTRKKSIAARAEGARDSIRERPGFATKEDSDRVKRVVGRRVGPVGDAFAFSIRCTPGVLFALRSGDMAADAVVEGPAKGDSGGTTGHWGAWVR